MSDITLNSLTFAGVGFNQNGMAVWSERSMGVPSGFQYLTEKTSVGTGKSGSSVKWNLSTPIVAEEDSSCSCVGAVLRTYYSQLHFNIPAGSTLAERTDLLAAIRDLVLTTAFSDSILNLAQPT